MKMAAWPVGRTIGDPGGVPKGVARAP